MDQSVQQSQDVQDVDFKEVQQSQMLDGQHLEGPKNYRILHVQVQGNPSTEDLNSIAQSFQQALQSGSDSVVTTTGNVSVFNIYEEGQPPFNGMLVRGAISIYEIARTIHDMEGVFLDRPFVHWIELSDEERNTYVHLVKLELRNRLTFTVPQDNNGLDTKVKAKIVAAVVNALRQALPDPQTSNLKPIQLWNGGLDPSQDSAWTDAQFTNLKNTMVFRYADNPAAYQCAVSDVYVNYEGLTSFLSVDAVSVVPDVTQNDDTKLEWKLKRQSDDLAAPVEPITESTHQGDEMHDLHDDNAGMPTEGGAPSSSEPQQ